MSPDLKTEQKEVVRLTNIVALIPLLAYSFYIFYGFFFQQFFSIALAGSMVLLTVIALLLNYRRKYSLAKFTLFALNSTSIWITYQVFTVDYSVLTSYFPILFCFPLFFDYTKERKTILFTAVFIATCLTSSFVLPKHLFHTIQLDETDAALSNLFHIVISFALTILVVYVVVRNWNRTKLKLVQERTKAEDRLAELTTAQYQLIKSEKMASLGVLISGISHEMNNPLNFVKQSAEFLQKEDSKDEINENMKQEYLRILGIGVERLTSIVRSLNSFNYSSLGKTKEISLSEILENCISIVKNSSALKLSFNLQLDDSLEVKGNEAQLHQIFLNLITNAEQAIAEQGWIKITSKRKEDLAIISIEDNGVGIPEDLQNSIFDPFFTTKDPGKGVGLGLCIAEEFLKNLNGKIIISSQYQLGTQVEVVIPCSKSSQLSLLD